VVSRAAPQGDAVPTYRFLFLDEEGRIANSGEAACPDDAQVLARARSLHHVHAVEVWEGSRLVGRAGAHLEGE